jgi:hypothetical protein
MLIIITSLSSREKARKCSYFFLIDKKNGYKKRNSNKFCYRPFLLNLKLNL